MLQYTKHRLETAVRLTGGAVAQSVTRLTVTDQHVEVVNVHHPPHDPNPVVVAVVVDVHVAAVIHVPVQVRGYSNAHLAVPALVDLPTLVPHLPGRPHLGAGVGRGVPSARWGVRIVSSPHHPFPHILLHFSIPSCLSHTQSLSAPHLFLLAYI